MPQLVPFVVLDMPDGASKLAFYTHKFRKDLVPEELTQGLQNGNQVTCMLGLAAGEPSSGALVAGDAASAAASPVESAVADAAENGAGSSVSLLFGQVRAIIYFL